ncbi:GAF domain-containing protein [Polaromonas jejuensis]|uniref:GAF domain-containing protein n=1 Tax=Polaromonas jejuensis TaxID=457502 RepID=A0ABW0Q769_9BURK|nr:GAF domain-containing protein [Polaromonas jejuensis]
MNAAPLAPEPTLAEIRPCLEGAIPAVMATCALDGTPNVAYISQVFYVDERHVALSFQFFNKTRKNILANPHATVLVLHPVTAAFFRMHIRYLRTETQGPVFEGMKAQLAGIASHSGMAGVFRLLGSDIYEVQAIECVAGEPLPAPSPRTSMLTVLRRGSERLSHCTGLGELLNATLATLTDFLDIRHAMVLMLDAATQRLYTVASCGYATSGVGSEIEMGEGVIGVAAREHTPVRIVHMSSAYAYSRAIKSGLRADMPELMLDTDIPYPGLAEPHSQLAVPIVSAGRLLGVLFAESPHDLQFGFEEEDVLVTLAGHLGAAIDLMQAGPEAAELPDAAPAKGVEGAARKAGGSALQLRRFNSNDSVFVNDSYLIKGVAGAIFWKLVTDYVRQGRTEFSNRELRLDPAIRLPDVTDNLEARLLLLQRRLAEHGPHIRIEKTGRGRFRLAVQRPLALADVAA